MNEQQSFDAHRHEIEHRYLAENKSLVEVMELMVTTRGFHKSKSAYERKLKEWGVHKNVQWRSLVGSIKKRQRDGKKSAIDVNAYKKLCLQVERSASRHFVLTFEQVQLVLGRDIQPPRVQSLQQRTLKLRTPSPIPSEAHSLILMGPWFSFLNFLNARTGKSGEGAVNIRIPSAYTSDSIPTLFSKLMLHGIDIPFNLMPSRYGERQSREMTERLPRSITTTPDYMLIQLFLLTNNFTFNTLEHDGDYRVPIEERARIHDERVVNLIQQAGSSNIASIKAVISEMSPVAKAIRGQAFASALRTANLPLLQAMLDTGFDPNIVVAFPDWRYGSPLQVAAKIKDEQLSLKIIGLLIRSGLVAQGTKCGLLWTVKLGHKEVVRLLIEVGARANHHTMLAAIMSGDEELVRMTLPVSPAVDSLHDHHTNKLTALVFAVARSDIAVAKILIKWGASVNAPQYGRDPWITTPLGIAASNGRLKMVRFLLDQKAAVGQPPLEDHSHYVSPLFAACYNGHSKVARILVESGASVSDVDALSVTHYYVGHCEGFVEALLRADHDGEQVETGFWEVLLSKAAGGDHTPLKASGQSPYNLQSFIMNLTLDSEDSWQIVDVALVLAIKSGSATLIKKLSTTSATIRTVPRSSM